MKKQNMAGSNELSAMLGRPSDDETLVETLASLGMVKAPKLKRGEQTAHLSNSELGLELAFRDERFLDVKSDKYAKGALVLSNITFFGGPDQWHKKFKRFDGQLPHGLTFGASKEELVTRWGKPGWTTEKEARWDLEGECVFATFGDGGLEQIAIQLPVKV